ncbi:MAG: PilW family protein [Pseudomonadota bacterium]
MHKQQYGTTLIELMVALAIGSFLIIGAVQIYNQSRQAFVINESIARVQETAQFAMDIVESDIRMSSNWGRTSRSLSIEGRSLSGNANPNSLTVPTDCGAQWVLDLGLPVDGDNNTYALGCDPTGTAMANSDVLTVRRASVTPTADATLLNGKLYVQSTRIQGDIVVGDGSTLVPVPVDASDPSTHNLMISSYYVATDSTLIPGTPSLRRKILQMNGGSMSIIDEEVAPGVENLQVQFGVDLDQDNTVDRYVNPGDEVYDPLASGYVPGARVMTARIWMIVRASRIEVGIQDDRSYEPGDRDLGTPTDSFRRMQISKTILLRNSLI